MISTITKNDFRDAFRDQNRHESWSYEGLGALYDFIEEVSPDSELDVIALDCDFVEDEPEYFLEQYGLDSIDELRDNTIVLEVPGRTMIIIQSY